MYFIFSKKQEQLEICLKLNNYFPTKIKDVSIRGKAKKIDIYEVLRMNDDK